MTVLVCNISPTRLNGCPRAPRRAARAASLLCVATLPRATINEGLKRRLRANNAKQVPVAVSMVASPYRHIMRVANWARSAEQRSVVQSTPSHLDRALALRAAGRRVRSTAAPKTRSPSRSITNSSVRALPHRHSEKAAWYEARGLLVLCARERKEKRHLLRFCSDLHK